MTTKFLPVNLLIIFCLLAFCCSLVVAQQPTLTNDDVINLVSSNVSEAVIIAKIKNSKCEFDTSSAAIIKLKESKVSDALIVTMLEADQKGAKVGKKDEQAKEDGKSVETKINISPSSSFVSTTASNLDLYPEEYEGKVVYLRAKVEDVVRADERVFSVGLSTGSISSYRNDYKYFPPILGRTGINFIAFADVSQALLDNKKYDLEATIGGLMYKVGSSDSHSWVFYIFNVNGFASNPNLLNTAFIGQTEVGFMNTYFLAVFAKQNVDTNIKNKDGRTALILSVINKNKDVLKGLIKLGAKLNEADKDGKTALMYAVELGIEDFVKELMKAGADSKIKDKSGKTAVDYSAAGSKNILKFFKNKE